MGDRSCLCLFAPDRAVFDLFLCLVFCVLYCSLLSLLKINRNNHAAFWSASPLMEESRNTGLLDWRKRGGLLMVRAEVSYPTTQSHLINFSFKYSDIVVILGLCFMCCSLHVRLDLIYEEIRLHCVYESRSKTT